MLYVYFAASCTIGTGSFSGVKSGRGVTLAPHTLLVSWSRKSRAAPLHPLWAVRPVQSLRPCTGVYFYLFTFLSAKALHQVTAAHVSLCRNGQQKTNAADDYIQSSATCVTRMMFWRCSVGSKRTWVVQTCSSTTRVSPDRTASSVRTKWCPIFFFFLAKGHNLWCEANDMM